MRSDELFSLIKKILKEFIFMITKGFNYYYFYK